ncbi:hypothetical protein [Aliiroseovarius sp. F47248L]|uniref:hypothetical protein n=1 Tax=Aliiroseovarius sp. F47248L TaxID=2926420 RepID=UPI001FF69E5E|nr:hypothetical protein [Aliiroseovarius sp. F47248L]MCK0138780.1 hypothetical protein [Aliiroseovarius sp. F47248L]
MEQNNKGQAFWASVESALPYVLPAIGGGAAVIYINTHKMDQMNPMIWIPFGIFLGWATSRGVMKLLDLWR